MSEEGVRPNPQAVRDAWVLATLPRALAYAMSLLHDRTLAEDVTHDCYARVLARGDSYELPRDGTKILYKSITHACIDRNYRDRRTLSLEFELSSGSADVPALADARNVDPCTLAAYRELEEAVAAALERLPVAQRGALELKSLGYSLEEIAEAVGVSPSNAGVLVHRARRAMAGQLARFLEQPSDE